MPRLGLGRFSCDTAYSRSLAASRASDWLSGQRRQAEGCPPSPVPPARKWLPAGRVQPMLFVPVWRAQHRGRRRDDRTRSTIAQPHHDERVAKAHVVKAGEDDVLAVGREGRLPATVVIGEDAPV